MYKINSRYIPTPFTKTARYSFDYTDPASLKAMDSDAENVAGSVVRIEAKVWQDEADGMDFDAMKTNLLRWGATEVDIRITRIPRENIRAASVLEAERLRDKLVRRAELVGETVDPEVLEMADLLQGTAPDGLIGMVMEGRA